MIRNYIIIAWRNLKKNRLTSFINIFGLTLSIAVCLLISLYIYDEVNYDTFEKDHEEIYRLENNFIADGKSRSWAASPAPLKEFIDSKFPEITSCARLMPNPFASVSFGEKKFKEENSYFADASILNVLGLTLKKGDAKTALSEPNSLVLAEKTAARIFGEKDPMNQLIVVNSKPWKITGILKDLPHTSHLQINMLRSIQLVKETEPMFTNWFANSIYTYARLKEGTNIDLLEDKLATALVDVKFTQKKGDNTFLLHKASSIHLDGNVEKELSQNSSWIFIYIFISVGILILMLASVNYINLTTSQSLKRAKEIGIRKTLGAFRQHLIFQFVSESILLTLISFILGITVVYLALPSFNNITGKNLSLLSLYHPFFILVSLGIILFIGILAGTYPAFFISSFDPVKAIKGDSPIHNNSGFSFGLRKSLVIFQFTISAFLVISSLVVIDQLTFMFNKPMGYNKENVMVIPAFTLSEDKLNIFRNELKTNPNILGVSATSAVPGKRVILGLAALEGKNGVSMRTMFTDADYLRSMNINLLEGRYFDNAILSDSSEAVIINEAAMKFFELKKPINSKIYLAFGNNSPKPCTLIGVVNDFHQGSLHNAVEPMIFIKDPLYNFIAVNFKGNDSEAIEAVNKIWSKLFPQDLFTFSYLKDDLKSLYNSEAVLKQLLIVFTILAIIIASLGLFGLIYFSSTLRKKEIGIRKVLGAGNSAIVYLLSKEYLILVSVSLIISIPLSNLGLDLWLNNFAYRIDISITSYLIGILIIMVIAFSTVFMQGLKSATENPVKNLRAE